MNENYHTYLNVHTLSLHHQHVDIENSINHEHLIPNYFRFQYIRDFSPHRLLEKQKLIKIPMYDCLPQPFDGIILDMNVSARTRKFRVINLYIANGKSTSKQPSMRAHQQNQCTYVTRITR